MRIAQARAERPTLSGKARLIAGDARVAASGAAADAVGAVTRGAIAVAGAGSPGWKGAALAALTVDAGAAVRVGRTLRLTSPRGAAKGITALIGARLTAALPVADVDAGHPISAATAVVADRSWRVVAAATVAVAVTVLTAHSHVSGRAVGRVGRFDAGGKRAARPCRAQHIAGHALPGACAVAADTFGAMATHAIRIARADVARPRAGCSAVLTDDGRAAAAASRILLGQIDRLLAPTSAAAEAEPQEAHDQPTADTPPNDTIRPHASTPSRA